MNVDTPAAEDSLLSAVASQLRAEVLQRWAAYFPVRAQAAAPDITFTPRRCGFSAIFKVDLDFTEIRARERLMVKIRREQKYGSFERSALTERTMAASRAEYNEHLKAHRFFAGRSDGLGVVRPIDYLESHNALLVEHAAGTDLSKLVRANSDLAASSIRKCGQWWRLFHHDLHLSSERDWNASALDPQFDRRLQRLQTFGVPTDLLEELRAEIKAATQNVPPVRVPVSLVHGDCKLRHVWATDTGIQVLDFGNARVGDSWRDPAALVVELSLYTLWSRRLDAAPQVDNIRTLLQAYFDGPPPRAFSLYVVDCLLKKWHRRLRNWGPGPAMNRIRKSLQTARLDKRLERLYIDRWFTTQIRAWLAVANGCPPAWLRKVVE